MSPETSMHECYYNSMHNTKRIPHLRQYEMSYKLFPVKINVGSLALLSKFDIVLYHTPIHGIFFVLL